MLHIKLIIRKWGQKVDVIAYLGFYLSATQKGVIILPYKFLNHEESSGCNSILSLPPFGALSFSWLWSATQSKICAGH